MQLHEYAADRYADLNVFSLAAENYLKAVKVRMVFSFLQSSYS